MKSPSRFPAVPLPPLASPSRQRWGLASLSLSMLLAALGTSVANVGLPALALALHASFQQVQWVTLAYLLTLTALSVSAGQGERHHAGGAQPLQRPPGNQPAQVGC